MAQQPAQASTEMVCPSIAIIGAGMAGLQAARSLYHDHNLTSTIFEARDRVGGRVHQVLVGGHLVDLGASWIHEYSSSNPLAGLAAQTRTVLHDDDNDTAAAIYHGVPQSFDVRESVYGLLEDALDASFNASETDPDAIDPDDDMLSVLTQYFDDNEDDESIREKALCAASSWAGSAGEFLEDLSARYAWTQADEDGKNRFVAETYRKILEFVEAEACEGANVLLNAEVDSVSSCGDKLSVRVKDGRSMHFDAVIVATPLGWLKANQDVFEPALPDNITSAIADIGFGRLEKIFISFPKAWWSNSSMLGWIEFWDPRNFEAAGLGNQTVGCILLAVLPGSTSVPVIECFVSGDTGRDMLELLRGKEVGSEEYEEVLDGLFRPLYSAMPGFDAEDANCKPTALRSSAWQEDSLAGNGSYTAILTGIEDLEGAFAAFAGGVPDRKIWFAGEHTAGDENFGTVHGAYLSGTRTAAAVAEALLK